MSERDRKKPWGGVGVGEGDPSECAFDLYIWPFIPFAVFVTHFFRRSALSRVDSDLLRSWTFITPPG